MNSGHDLGGMMGFGHVDTNHQNINFHEKWGINSIVHHGKQELIDKFSFRINVQYISVLDISDTLRIAYFDTMVILSIN